MSVERSQTGFRFRRLLSFGRLYGLLASRACSVIVFGALFYTLAVKFFHSYRVGLVSEYFGWIVSDIAVLLGIEVVLVAVCFRWPRGWVIRIALFVSGIVCTWSVMNAGWLIRHGMQILPTTILPLFRDPLNAFRIIGVNLAKMPWAALALLGPSAIALAFFFSVLAKPRPPVYSRKSFANRIFICLTVIFMAVVSGGAVAKGGSAQIAFEGLRYNCQLRAITSLLSSARDRLCERDLAKEERKIPAFDELRIELSAGPRPMERNVVIVILEGIQYGFTSLAGGPSEEHFGSDYKVVSPGGDLTPFLAKLAHEGVEFTNTRASVTHTTKALFSLLTGRYPSVAQDIAETVPRAKAYAGIATILEDKLNFRTAFFQSAKGNFESRPGLVHNLGFDKFWARDDLNDPNAFIGYLACDEFAMLKPITEWISADTRPFLLTVLCSVTHDPYEVPEWFAEPADELIERYGQAISYTDEFLAALDVELTRLNLSDRTIFCVIGDHGEAFGEHGQHGHERIAFEEALRIPWLIRAPFLIEPASKVAKPVSSVDLTPTLLALLGCDIAGGGFDGFDGLGDIPDGRKSYFSGWLRQSLAGFIKGNQKFMYDPVNREVFAYDLSSDPYEQVRLSLPEQQAQEIADDVMRWRKRSIFELGQEKTGRQVLFDSWRCRWSNRVSDSKYRPEVLR